MAVLLAVGCNVQVQDDDDDSVPGGNHGPKLDTDELEDQVKETVDDIKDTEICPGYTVSELLKADSLSDECRDAVLSFLPDPETTFEGRLIAPGGARVVDGELHVLLQGADEDGNAVTAADLMAGLSISVTVNGEAQVIDSDSVTFTIGTELPTDLLSIAVVNDYSASMLDGDLEDVEEVERNLFSCLPAIHETEVFRFSETVDRVLEFSIDADEIDDALARDDAFMRGTTALLDGLGLGLHDLSTRERPVHLVILATDGRENASTMFEKPEVLAALDQPNTFIVVLGALLADVDMVRELAKSHGVFFYTREFKSLAASVQPFCASLSELTELRIPLDGATPDSVHLAHADVELDLELEVAGP